MPDWRTLDFAEIDSRKGWHFYADRIITAKKLGYNFVSEAICHLYYECQYSATEIGELFDSSCNAISYRLKSWGLDMRRQGGATHFTGTYPIIKELKTLEQNWKGTRKKLYEYAGQKYNISWLTAKEFYGGKTWAKQR